MSNLTKRKRCFVPGCTNISENSSKIFLSVPTNVDRRKKWFLAVNMERSSRRRDLYCCEDHFDLERDAANWMYYKTIGRSLVLKADIVPHKFLSGVTHRTISILTEEEIKRKAELLEKRLTKQNQEPIDMPVSVLSVGGNTESFSVRCLKKSIGIQTNLKPSFRSRGVNTGARTAYIGTSPSSSSDTESMLWATSSSSFSKVNVYGFSDSSDCEHENLEMKVKEADYKKHEIFAIESNSQFFLGIPQNIYNVVHQICGKASIPYEDFLISLKKIRLNDPYQRLAIDFGMSISKIHDIFIETVPKITKVLQYFIFWPDPTDIRRNVPDSFTACHSNIQSIIDCFEVEIENPVVQASSWSENKNCDTVKFLLSCTPSGFINFISEAYTGRISDSEIVKQCTYLDELPKNSCVLADEGFESVATLIQRKGCDLVRPSSISSQVKPIAQDVQENEMIASLQISVGRVIQRIREFSILKAHACVHHNLVPILSHIVMIVCAIINLQEPIDSMTE